MSKVDRVKGGRNELNQVLEATSRSIQIYPNVYPELYLLSSKYGYGIQELRARAAMHF